jgi:hypothetical protein
MELGGLGCIAERLCSQIDQHDRADGGFVLLMGKIVSLYLLQGLHIRLLIGLYS